MHTFNIHIVNTHTHTHTVVLISLKLAAQQRLSQRDWEYWFCVYVCALVCKALPNWAVLVREDFATAKCMCVFPSYKHAVVWFCICKHWVNCSQRCVYNYMCMFSVCECVWLCARMRSDIGTEIHRWCWWLCSPHNVS